MRSWGISIAMLLVLAAGGCGGKDPVATDPAPFAAAIQDYLKRGNMGLEIGKFEALTRAGKSAQAKVSLHAADMPQVSVHWQFTLTADDAGKWSVTGHQE